ncbi:carboxypeptidase-like regulatory domain-containing protein [Kaistella anthropi]|nr:carboxypeptidase-like regulatory domain-containing protein [Kaistella anthropi]
MNTFKKSALIAAIAFCGYGTVNAQVTTSSIQGVVTKASGATVTATHIPTGTVYTGTINNSGSFNIPNMRVGDSIQN